MIKVNNCRPPHVYIFSIHGNFHCGNARPHGKYHTLEQGLCVD